MTAETARRFTIPAGPLTAAVYATPSRMYLDQRGTEIDPASLAPVAIGARILSPGYHDRDACEPVTVNGVAYRVDISLRLADGAWIEDRTGGAYPRMQRIGGYGFGADAEPTDKARRYLWDVIVPAAILAVAGMPEEIDRALAVRAGAYAESARALAARLRALADGVDDAAVADAGAYLAAAQR